MTGILLILAIIVCCSQGQFQYELQGVCVNRLDFTRKPYEHYSLIRNATYMQNYDYHRLISMSRDVHGIFGIVLGAISVYVLWVGASYRLHGMERDLEDLPRTLMTSVSLMSVMVAILTFALQKEQYYELIGHIFPVSIILLGVFFLSLGLLITQLRYRYGGRHEIVVLTSFLGLAISFVIGFVWGDIAIPFSRTPMFKDGMAVLGLNQEPIFMISPGSYFFMAMLLVSLGLYVRMLLLSRSARDAISVV